MAFTPALFAASAPTECPEGIGAREGTVAPIALVPSHDFALMVCGHKYNSTGSETVISEFKVYSIDKSNQLSAPLMEVTASDDYKLIREPNKIVLQQIEKIENDKYPVLETTIACDKKCTVTKPKCILHPPKIKDDGATDKFERYLSGDKKGKNPKEELVNKVYWLALSGNKKAQKLLKLSDSNPSLHDESGEIYERSKVVLQKLKEANCLK